MTGGSFNHFKLDQLIGRSYVLLRELFKNRYSLLNSGVTWDDSPTCGNNYFTSVVSKNKAINLTPVQRTAVKHGNSAEWDSTTLTALLLYADLSNKPKSINKESRSTLKVDF